MNGLDNTGDGGIQQQMKDARAAREAGETAKAANQADTQQETKRTQQIVDALLERLRDEYLQGEDQLQGYGNPAGSGFGIGRGDQMSLTGRNFLVTATCTGSQVELNVIDGTWENVPNVSGNWANWTDQKRIYVGPVDDAAIRQQLNRAFLAWYRNPGPLQ